MSLASGRAANLRWMLMILVFPGIQSETASLQPKYRGASWKGVKDGWLNMARESQTAA